jgi:hypothetical protein
MQSTLTTLGSAEEFISEGLPLQERRGIRVHGAFGPRQSCPWKHEISRRKREAQRGGDRVDLSLSGLKGDRGQPECKPILLVHAFDGWGAVTVQLKTDDRNCTRSALY